jgi:hypothetical protein
MLSLLHDVSISPGYRTDHSMIELELKFNNFIKGRRFWRFNNSLLRDTVYVQKVKDIISETNEEYYSDQMNSNQTPLSIDDDLFLEIILMKIRQMTIYYASKKSKERKKTKRTIGKTNQIHTEPF